jgi:type IV pilus assembly protein PilM
MISFLDLNPDAFGIDISDYAFKVAKLAKAGKFFKLVSWGETEIPRGLVVEGEIKDEDELAKIIKADMSKISGEKIRTKNVVASLPEKKLFLQVIQMPKMKKDDLEKAIYFEAENYIPFSIDEVYLDFQIIDPISQELDHFDVLLAASPKYIVDSYVSCLKKAGLRTVALEIESQSIIHSLIEKETTTYPVLTLDLGRESTKLVIFSGKAIRFTSTIPFASQEITDAIAKSFNISPQDAEAMKRTRGLTGPADKNQKDDGLQEKICQVAIPLLEKMTSDVKRCINFYHTHSSHEHLSEQSPHIKKIIICGGGASLEGLAGFISSRLNTPVEVGNPWINITPKNLKNIPPITFGNSLALAEVLGLALRGVKLEEVSKK